MAIGAAATAAAVEATLSTPLGVVALPQLERMSHELNQTSQAVIAPAKPMLGGAGARLTSFVETFGRGSGSSSRVPVGSSIRIAPPSAQSAAGVRIGDSIGADQPNRTNRSYSRALVRKILRDAALRHGVDVKLVLALSYWESGWDQSRVSETGAIGLMQVEPDSANEAGPALLGRSVDLDDPYDNADVGTAIFHQDLKAYGDPAMALAAYYQGPTSLREHGMLPDTQGYVDGILSLANTMTP